MTTGYSKLQKGFSEAWATGAESEAFDFLIHGPKLIEAALSDPTHLLLFSDIIKEAVPYTDILGSLEKLKGHLCELLEHLKEWILDSAILKELIGGVGLIEKIESFVSSVEVKKLEMLHELFAVNLFEGVSAGSDSSSSAVAVSSSGSGKSVAVSSASSSSGGGDEFGALFPAVDCLTTLKELLELLAPIKTLCDGFLEATTKVGVIEPWISIPALAVGESKSASSASSSNLFKSVF